MLMEGLEPRTLLSRLAFDDSTLAASATNDGDIVLTFLDREGFLSSYEEVGPSLSPLLTGRPEHDQEFVHRRLSTEPITETGQPVSWNDTENDLLKVAVPTTEGVLLYTRDPNSGWSSENISEGRPDAVITSDITEFRSIPGVQYMAGMNGDGELILFTKRPQGWVVRNLTVESFQPRSLETPNFTEMISYVTSWNGLNIAGITPEGELQAVWIAPGVSEWQVANLSEKSGESSYAGGLTAFLTPWDGINLAGITDSGAIVVSWWVPSFGGDWARSDFNEAFGGPRLSADSLAAYVTPWNALNIVGTDVDSGDVVTYWWVPAFRSSPDNDYWRVTNLTNASTNPVRPDGALTTLITPSQQMNIFGVDSDNSVTRLSWSAEDRWRGENLSETSVEAHVLFERIIDSLENIDIDEIVNGIYDS